VDHKFESTCIYGSIFMSRLGQVGRLAFINHEIGTGWTIRTSDNRTCMWCQSWAWKSKEG